MWINIVAASARGHYLAGDITSSLEAMTRQNYKASKTRALLSSDFQLFYMSISFNAKNVWLVHGFLVMHTTMQSLNEYLDINSDCEDGVIKGVS